MKIDPPIRYVGANFVGHIVEVDDKTDEVIVRLENGKHLRLSGDEKVSVRGPGLDA